MRRAAVAAALALAGLAAVLVVRALLVPSRQLRPEPAPRVEVDAVRAGERLAASLRFETITHQDPSQVAAPELAAFQAWLERSYPRLHARLARERVAQHSLLYTWKGRDPALGPLVLLAHQDVVAGGDAAAWTHPPFAGVRADGFVFGRGAMDDKGPLVALCEAVEGLLASGFEPERDVLLAFGHDEERGGKRGARAVAELLAARGVRAALVLDEGLAVAEGVLPGLDAPVAAVGVAEKGLLTLELRAEAPGGHSSTPPRESAIGIVAAAVGRLERTPLPGGLRDVTRALLGYLAPELSFGPRLVLANLWLFGGLIDRALPANPAIDALLRTTTAVTIFHAGEKDNVLPSEARAAVNFRILPGDTMDSVEAHARRTIADPRIALRRVRGRDPSPTSPIGDETFRLLQRTIGEIHPDAVVAPALTLGGTDARHYVRVSPHVYRFLPFVFDRSDLGRPHGTDERLSLANLELGIRFYARLIQNADAPLATEGAATGGR